MSLSNFDNLWICCLDKNKEHFFYKDPITLLKGLKNLFTFQTFVYKK